MHKLNFQPQNETKCKNVSHLTVLYHLIHNTLATARFAQLILSSYLILLLHIALVALIFNTNTLICQQKQTFILLGIVKRIRFTWLSSCNLCVSPAYSRSHYATLLLSQFLSLSLRQILLHNWFGCRAAVCEPESIHNNRQRQL